MDFLIDVEHITNFNLSQRELELHLLFWVLVTGKTAKTTARNLDKLLKMLDGNTPFQQILSVRLPVLIHLMKTCGIGCYNQKARTLRELSNSGLDLKRCSVEDLEKITGIGRKTSRCFILHSRKDARCAGLDVHMLKHLRSLGYNVPKSTPSSDKEYKKIEAIVLNLADQSGSTTADFDLNIWRNYSHTKYF